MAERSERLLRVAIAGCGRIGSGRGSREGADLWYTHAGAYARHPRTELVAAADIDRQRLDRCGRSWNVASLYSSVEAMLAAERIDILSICTPDENHAATAMAAIAAGVPALFCEKPLDSSLDAAQRLVETAMARGTRLAVNHHRRWEQGHREVRRRIAGGVLGPIQRVRVLYAGPLGRVGTHGVDLLRYFFGEVVEVRAQAGDRGEFVLRFAGEVLATFAVCDQQAFDLFEIDIVGTAGRIVIADFGARILQWTVEPNPEYGGDLELSATPVAIASDMRQAFVDGVDAVVAALDHGAPLDSSGADALATLRVVDAVARTSARSDSQPLRA